MILLKKQGWQPVGVSLELFGNYSFSEAKKVCQKLKVPHYIVDVQKEFKSKVVDYFISELKKGRTPNPCVICNYRLKFKNLFVVAKEMGAEYVATGHYARIREVSSVQCPVSSFELLKARDKSKDQSYYLSFLPQKWLGKIVFPLGEYAKEQVYKIVRSEALDELVKKKESQDFCYLAGSSVEEFIRKEIKTKKGLIVNSQGKILGEHRGLPFYTIGQRRRIRLAGGPYYVKSFDLKKNILVVTKDKKQISQREIYLCPFNFISGKAPKKQIKVMAKIRYRQPLSRAVLYPPKGKKLKIVFDRQIFAVTPGQFCVFYNKEVCLGGGVIL